MEDREAISLAERYVDFLVKRKILVTALVVVILGLSGALAPRFMDKTSQSFDPPSSSMATQARNTMNDYFPLQRETSGMVIYVENRSPTDKAVFRPVLSEDLRIFTLEFAATCNTTGIVLNVAGYYIVKLISNNMAKAFLAGGIDGQPDTATATFISIEIEAGMTDKAATEYAKQLKNTIIPDIQQVTNTSHYEMTLMGSPAFLDVMISSSTSDLERMDATVLPLAMLILAFILKSLKLIIIPVLCLLVSAGVSFAIMFGVACTTTVFTGAPSLMMSILIAMSIDYGLFMLSRFREVLLDQQSRHEQLSHVMAITIMISSAGHTIVVSGITLAACFFGLVFFRLDILQSLGIGCGVVLIVVLLTNLVLTPLLLLWFPNFFMKCIRPIELPSCLRCGKDTDSSNESERSYLIHGSQLDPEEEDGLGGNIVGEIIPLKKQSLGSVPHIIEPSDESSTWHRIGSKVVRFPFNVLVPLLVVGLSIPFDLYAFTYTSTDNNLLYLPKHSEVTRAYVRMGNTFGWGTVYAYQILILPSDRSQQVLNSTDYKVWKASQNFLSRLAKTHLTRVQDIVGPSYDGSGRGIPVVEGDVMQNCINMLSNPSIDISCDTMTQKHTNETKACMTNIMLACSFMDVPTKAKGMWFRYTPQFAPMGKDGEDWLKTARDLASQYPTEADPIEIFFVGEPADAIDAVNGVDDDFPTMIGITTAVVLVFVGVSFKSLFIPLRSVFTIGLTVVWVYGFATLTYEHGALEWTHFEGFDSTHAIVYIIPLMSFSIVVGIGLDYDIFLITRIVEYRRAGYSTVDSICHGLAKTGYIITAAGVIMAVAFSGLLFSEEPFMHQLSFYMVFAVLFDTFVIRSVVVPALMGLLGELNWWPMTLPREPKSPINDNRSSSYGSNSSDQNIQEG
eukprot:TRINITY_DN18595_c0_g1_i1.p1 TRINITY_DN18595_c0_g1~~TRINITY_DN18595_c0_g1_i1.p1  ORF type:complete len:904 (+),score=124.20 TRINITY_DN18595_c0_g1_i1:135-2846(+)